MLRHGQRVERNAVLVHDGSRMSFPSSSSPFGRPVLSRGVAGRAKDRGAQALCQIRELAVKLATVVAQHVVRDAEKGSTTSG